jgi:hypothetical protein
MSDQLHMFLEQLGLDGELLARFRIDPESELRAAGIKGEEFTALSQRNLDVYRAILPDSHVTPPAPMASPVLGAPAPPMADPGFNRRVVGDSP